jgi:hypothetical protein
MSGWICLHKDIQDHWIYKDPEKLRCWIDMLLIANFEDSKFLIKGQLIECKRGQLAYSQETLGDRWKWTRGKVRNFLNLLEKDSMISLKSNHLTTIITICNYSKFQDIQPTKQPADNQLTTSSETADNQLTDTYNNITTKQLNKEEIVKTKTSVSVPYEKIVSIYQETLPSNPGVAKITDKRKNQIKKLWVEDPGVNSLEDWQGYFSMVKESKFLTGQNGRKWFASLDFLTKYDNFLKIVEGEYSQ